MRQSRAKFYILLDKCLTTNPDECKGVGASASKSGAKAQTLEDIV